MTFSGQTLFAGGASGPKPFFRTTPVARNENATARAAGIFRQTRGSSLHSTSRHVQVFVVQSENV